MASQRPGSTTSPAGPASSKARSTATFPTKEELFRAVVRSAVVPNVESVRGAAEDFDGPFAELAPRLLVGRRSRAEPALIARFVRW